MLNPLISEERTTLPPVQRPTATEEKRTLGKLKADKWRRDFFSPGGSECAEEGRLAFLRELRGSA
jgi:hypothetical protein